jgi:glutathione peroxidase
MRRRASIAIAGLAAALAVGCGGMSDESSEPAAPSTESSGDGATVLDHTVSTLTGDKEKLDKYKGKVVLVVNTATECGYTPQFEGLEKLYEQKKGEGFVILGFPADDVANQEPRDDEAIADFCQANFGVSFPMFEKSNLVSDPLNPVYAELNAAVGAPTWNFNKVLLNREGVPLKRFEVKVKPEDPELVDAIDAELAKS